MLFDCIRCGKTFKTKNVFCNHLKKNGVCEVQYISIPKKIYIEKYNIINDLFEDNYNQLIESDSIPKLHYGCERCGNLYTSASKSYYYKHKKKCNRLYLNESETDSKNNILELTTPSIQTYIPYQEPNKSMDKSQNQNSLNTHNSHNHVQTYNTQNNPNININNNITIKNYNDGNDEEILNSIPNHIKQQILKKPHTAITDLYKLIHIDNPQYRNIYIGSLKDGHGKVLKDGDWTSIQMKQLLEDAVVQSSDRLYDIANDETVNVKKSYLDKITKLLDNIAENGNITNNYKNEIKTISYHFREIIKANYEESNNRKLKLRLKQTSEL